MTKHNEVDDIELWLLHPDTTFEEIDRIANGTNTGI